VKVIVADDADQAARIVADTVVDLLCDSSDVVLGLAAGRTFEEAYRLIVEKRPPIDGLSVVLLDEYHGLTADDVHGFRYEVRHQLTDGLGLDPSRLYSLNGAEPDSLAECRRFEETISQLGGVDLQLLGLGRNGHIAFNEPGSTHDSRTRLIDLDEGTRAANAPAFGEVGLVPRQALTQGIGTILESRKIILMASGSHKADAVAAALSGPVSEQVPASALQTHRSVTVALDSAAAALLDERC
jgi:glucosamine-6-phosphate deaminase